MADLQRTPCYKQATTVCRSSSRLQEKSQRQFSLPTRKEVLDSVVPDDKTPFKNYSNFKPRKLINNFVKERNTYNNPDKIDLFDEFSDDDFINDKSSSDDDTSDSSDQESSSTTRDSVRNGVIIADNNSDSELAKPLRSHKQRLAADSSSGSDTDDTQGDFASAVGRKKRQRRVTIHSDSSSENDEEQRSHLKSSQDLGVGHKPQDLDLPEKVKDQDNCHEEECQPPTSTQDLQVGQKLTDLQHTPNVHARKAADYKSNQASSSEDSDDSFVATDSSSDDVLDLDLGADCPTSNMTSHEELICNYRQKKRPRKLSRIQNKKHLCSNSLSSSSSIDSLNEGGSDCDGKTVERPPSKRADRLKRRKLAWKNEVLGSYKTEREKKLKK